MFGARLFSIGLLCFSIHAQEAAVQLRALLRDTPRLAVEEVPLAARMANAASLGTVSSVAADANGVIYVLQRGDKADPVITVARVA